MGCYLRNISDLTSRGRLIQDKTSKKPKLNCRNWECGIIVPVLGSSASNDHDGPSERPGMDMFHGIVPIPMQMPAEDYRDSAKVPWFFGGED